MRPFQEYTNSLVAEERQKSTIMDNNENISDNMAEKVEQAEDINDEKNHKRLENKELNTNENSPFNIESFCSIQLTELEEDEKELKECGGSDMVGKLQLWFNWDFYYNFQLKIHTENFGTLNNSCSISWAAF